MEEACEARDATAVNFGKITSFFAELGTAGTAENRGIEGAKGGTTRE